MLQNLTLILPEMILFLGAMGLLMIGAFSKGDAARTVNLGAIAILALAAATAGSFANNAQATAFNGAFVMDSFAALMKVLTFVATGIAIIMSQGYMRLEKLARFEYPVLLLLAAAGMGMMISANDLIALYMGIELQSLALYVVAAINRDSLRSTEAGLKYFVLGA
ncbi:proton-conducting transporter membrane subunit, partial [Alphaproteobacteria bacterium]|nr:proton-conducting transporter membrane subunit [Alphaproteobacteria bacterium]